MEPVRPVPLVNADKVLQWNADIAASVDSYNAWFMESAPEAYRRSRSAATAEVERAFLLTDDLLKITPADLKVNAAILRILRMSTIPPIARDRLIGLAGVPGGLVRTLEKGKLPGRVTAADLDDHLRSICGVIDRLLDRELLQWLPQDRRPSDRERSRAATIVADRLCGADADPIIRNSQEQRQKAVLTEYLLKKGYAERCHPPAQPLTSMEPGTFCRLDVKTGPRFRVPVDLAVQPKVLRPSSLPILIECKSAGDYANVNKRRKEEAEKMSKLKATLGPQVEYVLFLCGYFGAAYLGHEAAAGIDWIWEHRIGDLDRLGI